MLTCQRHLFSLPAGLHYLNMASRGPLLKAAESAGIEGLRTQKLPRPFTAATYVEPVEALRASFGGLINASPDRVAIVPAASYAIAIAAHNTPLRAGQNVVLPAEEFPSDVLAWREGCREHGAELRLVPRPPPGARQGAEWNARLLEAIDDRTAVVNLSAVHWTDGLRFDLEAIGTRAREVDALFVVDGSQSVGAAPFDFQRVRPDLLVCVGYKWLLGPYQIAFAVLGERLLEARPFEFHWSTRAEPLEVARIDYDKPFRPGARRFDAGQQANPITLPMVHEGLRQVQAWGPAAIRDYCAALTDRLATLLQDERFVLTPAEHRSAHIVGIRIAQPERLPALLETLQARDIQVSLRGTSLRVSPYLYNDEADLAALAEALLDALH